MKKLLLPVLLILMVSVKAQKKEKLPVEYENAISISPLMLLGPDYTLTLGYEKRLRPFLVLSTEAGVVMGSAHFSSGDDPGAWGILIRPSIKFFVNEEKNFYLQPQLFYKMVNHNLYDWLGKNCVNDIHAYEELQEFTYRRQAFGFNAIAGVLVPTRGRKMMFDFYLGLGIRHKTANVADEPDSCYDPVSFGFGTFNQTGTFPNIPGGVRMVFVL
jgi:hypothetical protein